jgi:uridine kinase
MLQRSHLYPTLAVGDVLTAEETVDLGPDPGEYEDDQSNGQRDDRHGERFVCDGHLVDSMLPVAAYESVSSWRQPLPLSGSPARVALINQLADTIAALSPGCLRVAVDGYTASGKTSFAHELAAALRDRGRPTLRASMDDFKHPWRDAHERGYDRTSGEGYYRNAYDFASARDLLLRPMVSEGSGRVALCAHDPLTGVDHRGTMVDAPIDAVLIVDTVFAFRPEYNDHWDYRIWLDVDPVLALSRGVARDSATEGRDEALRVHRDRYQVAEAIYISEVDPVSRADVSIDNSDFPNPRVLATGEAYGSK